MSSRVYCFLVPVYVTSASVDNVAIDEFLAATRTHFEADPEDEHNGQTNMFRIQRTFDDTTRALVEDAEQDVIDGDTAPISANGQLDFLGWSVDELADYTTERICNYSSTLGKWVKPHPKYNDKRRINDEYFVVLDARFARDRCPLIVGIPTQTELDQGDTERKLVTRTWPKREAYNDPKLWEDTSGIELEAARVDIGQAAMLTLIIGMCRGSVDNECLNAIEAGISQAWEPATRYNLRENKADA